MKITKNSLKQLIKEELEAMQEQEPEEMGGDELKQSYTFRIARPGHYRGDSDTNIVYAVNVPLSMLDTKDYEEYKVTHKNPERFLKISKEGLQRLGFEANEYGNYGVEMYPVEQIPETIEIKVPYNPRTGEFMTNQVKSYMIPKVVDASSM